NLCAVSRTDRPSFGAHRGPCPHARFRMACAPHGWRRCDMDSPSRFDLLGMACAGCLRGSALEHRGLLAYAQVEQCWRNIQGTQGRKYLILQGVDFAAKPGVLTTF